MALLPSWLTLREGEGRPTLVLSGLHFLVIASFTLARIARDGVFLSELPAERLPWVYVALAVWSAIAIGILDRTTRRLSTERVLAGLLFATAVSLILLRLFCESAPGPSAIVLYLWVGAYGPALVSQFWLLANESTDPRQAKRIFAVTGAAGILGGLVAGGATSALIGHVQPLQLLPVTAVLHVVAAVVVLRWTNPATKELAGGVETVAIVGTRQALSDPYVRLLITLFLAAGMSTTVLDYLFKFGLQRGTDDPGQITAVLGLFYGAQNVIALMAQLGLAGWMLTRFGARKSSMLLPVGVLAGSVTILAMPLVTVVALARLYDASLRVSIARTAWEFLFFPLADGVRKPAKRFLDVVVSRGADAGAGFLVLAINAVLGGSVRQLAVAVAALTAIWLSLEVRAGTAYAREVTRSLRRMVRAGSAPAVERAALEPEDLKSRLENPDEREALFALTMLDRTDPGAIVERAQALLQHPSIRVRGRAMATLVARGESIDDFDWHAAHDLNDRRGEAMAETDLEENVADRVAVAAAAARRFGSEIPRLRLPELFEDSEPDVRWTAFRSAGARADRSLVPALISRLSIPEDRRVVREALVLYGRRVVGTLADHLVDAEEPVGLRMELVRVLAEIRDPDAALALFRATRLGVDRRIAERALEALNTLRERDDGVRLPEADLLDALESEIVRYARRMVQTRAVRSLRDDDLRLLLERVLGERTSQSLNRIFRRLALVYPTRDLLLAREGFLGQSLRSRAQSLEVLETRLGARHRQMLLPLLEAPDEAERVRRAGLLLEAGSPSFFGVVAELLESREDWLRACGLYAVGRLKLQMLAPEVTACLQATDPVVRESAQWARKKLATA